MTTLLIFILALLHLIIANFYRNDLGRYTFHIAFISLPSLINLNIVDIHHIILDRYILHHSFYFISGFVQSY